MKRTLLWVLFALSTAVQGATLDGGIYPPELKPAPDEAHAAHLAAELLARYHYKALPVDSALSTKIFDQYLKSLDPERMFFVQADIDRLAAYRTKLGDAILQQDLNVPFSIFNLYEQRAAERFVYARNLLKDGFDFKQNESYQYIRENAPWPKTEAEAQELWRKRVKNDWLRLKLAGKDDKSAFEILDKRYDTSQRSGGEERGCLSDVHECLHHGHRPAHQLSGPAGSGGIRHCDETLAGGNRCRARGGR
jgi:carboxyl-terminal processing protease